MNGSQPTSRETFCVIVPTYNRAHLLPRALDSLLAQTYSRWLCWIIDDGSTDCSAEVIRRYVDADERFQAVSLPENRGGVAANEVGMDIACAQAPWWSRLGSDDAFLPHKLELDARALERHGATFGPFQVHSIDGEPEEVRGMPIGADETRRQLETPGGFNASWANVAARTEVLGAVKERFGNYVDPRLRNTEDLLFNFRVSTITDWIWRGRIDGALVIDPPADLCDQRASGEGVEHDAIWTRNPVGVTANTQETRAEGALSYGLIAAEHQSTLWPSEPSRPGSRVAAAADSEKFTEGDSCALGELEARRVIGELLWTRATCNWNVSECGDSLGKIWEIGGATSLLEGSVAEVGVAPGGTARLLSAMFPRKTLYAIDSFEGLSNNDLGVDVNPAETFAEITAEALRDCRNVAFYRGVFPAVIDAKLAGDRFSLVHLDTQTHGSILDGLEFFVPRLVAGGMIFVDDYLRERTPGVQRAVDEALLRWPALSLRRTTPVQALLQLEP